MPHADPPDTGKKRAPARSFGMWLAGLPAQEEGLPTDWLTRLTAWALFFLTLLLGATSLVLLVMQGRLSGYFPLLLLLLPGLTLFFLAAWVLNRKRQPRLAGLLSVFASLAVVWLVLFVDEGVRSGTAVGPYYFVALPMLLAAALLGRTLATTVILAQPLGLLLLLSSDPRRLTAGWVAPLLFLLFILFASIGINQIIQTFLELISQQTRQFIDQQAKIKEFSIRDSLTGLYNRGYLDETIRREISRVTRRGSSLGVILIDLDHFKTVQDTYGHTAADEVLKEVGQRLAARIRDADIACRYGGDAFVLVMPDTSFRATHQRADSLRLLAKTWTFTVNGRTLAAPTLSCGLACFPQDGKTGQAVLQAAEEALIRAKQKGRDRVESASVPSAD